jgi:hypothetical protein
MIATAPVCLALVMGDFVWADPNSGKKTILGTFDEIQPYRYPFTLPTLAVYSVFSNGRGRVHIGLRIIDAADSGEEPIAVTAQDFDFPDPLHTIETSALFQNVTFSGPGEYRVQARAVGQTLLERRLLLKAPP